MRRNLATVMVGILMDKLKSTENSNLMLESKTEFFVLTNTHNSIDTVDPRVKINLDRPYQTLKNNYDIKQPSKNYFNYSKPSQYVMMQKK